MKRAQLFAPFFIKMEIITSTQNQFVKQVRSLREKKFRDKTGLFVVEGIKMFREAPMEWIEGVYVSEQFMENPEHETHIQWQ